MRMLQSLKEEGVWCKERDELWAAVNGWETREWRYYSWNYEQSTDDSCSATAVAHCKAGKGLVKVNGQPLHLVKPEVLRFKVYEPLLIVGLEQFANVDIRVRVTGGGHTSQVYAIRQAIAKSIVAYYQKFVDEHSKNHIKQLLVQYDRTLLVADNRRCEPKKFGGPGARARYQSTFCLLTSDTAGRWLLTECPNRILPLILFPSWGWRRGGFGAGWTLSCGDYEYFRNDNPYSLFAKMRWCSFYISGSGFGR